MYTHFRQIHTHLPIHWSMDDLPDTIKNADSPSLKESNICQ